MPRRKKQKEKTSKKGSFKFGRVLLWLLLLFLFLYLIYFLFNVLTVKTVDVAFEDSASQNLFSRRKNNLEKTLVVIEESVGGRSRIVGVYAYLQNRSKKSELLIYLPGQIYYSGLEEKFGNEIPVSSFRYAGDFLQKGKGVEYAVWQMNQLLGFKSDMYIYLSSDATKVVREMSGNGEINFEGINGINEFTKALSWHRMFSSAKQLADLDGKIYSNIPFYTSRLALESLQGNEKKYKRSVLDLSDKKYLKDGKLLTGEEIKVLNTKEYDKSLDTVLSTVLDRNLENERVRVEVYNGSALSGVAYSFGRKITNSGCNVVRYENAPNVVEKTLVYVPDVESFKTAYSVVSDVIPVDFDLVEGRPDFMTTGDIVVILGKNIKSMYSF